MIKQMHTTKVCTVNVIMSFWCPKGVGKYNKGFSKEVEIIDIWSQVSPRTLLVPRAVTPFSNRDVLSGHVYQRKQLSKIKFAPVAPPKQTHIALQNLDLFKKRCYAPFPRDVNTLSFTCCNESEAFKIVMWSGHVHQRKQLLKIKFAQAAPPKQMHIMLQNLDYFKNWIVKPRCYMYCLS